MSDEDLRPLVVHVIHRLGTGGMENGLVNLINRAPSDRYRHAVVCLTDADSFAERIMRSDVPVVTLHRPPGHSFGMYWTLWKVLLRLRPKVIHTRNLSTLEAQIVAWFVPGAVRVHGEHGRDVFDLHGANRKYNLLRRAVRPLVQRYVAVSRDLERWLVSAIGVAPGRIRQIYNGVDQSRFHPLSERAQDRLPAGFAAPEAFVVGTVGRLAEVKDQATLVRAFSRMLRGNADEGKRARLIIVGEGPMRGQLEALIRDEGLEDVVWMAGDRDDVAELLGCLGLFVLPSLGEGISNTILEAMACGLPVIATDVGGNPELVDTGVTGLLVPAGDPDSLAKAMAAYLRDPELGKRHGRDALAKVTRRFCWDRCVAEYLDVYDELLGRKGGAADGAAINNGL